MSKRLLTLRQIRAEKFARGRSWIYEAMRKGEFPRPVGGVGPHLWLESDVDAFVEQYVARAQATPKAA